MKLFSYAIIMSIGMETADFSVCTAVHIYGKPSATIHKITSAEEFLALSVFLVCKIQTRTVYRLVRMLSLRPGQQKYAVKLALNISDFNLTHF